MSPESMATIGSCSPMTRLKPLESPLHPMCGSRWSLRRWRRESTCWCRSRTVAMPQMSRKSTPLLRAREKRSCIPTSCGTKRRTRRAGESSPMAGLGARTTRASTTTIASVVPITSRRRAGVGYIDGVLRAVHWANMVRTTSIRRGFYWVVRNPNGPLPSAIARFQRR